MRKELNIVNEKFIARMKETKGILAAWYFGSNQHGLSDEYSDIDIILLADEAEYHSIDKNLTEILKELCDDVLLCWGEDFNSDTQRISFTKRSAYDGSLKAIASHSSQMERFSSRAQ